MSDYKIEPSLTATHLLEYLYCPRYTFFGHVSDIKEHQEKRFKVQQGREAHLRVRKTNPDYLRKKIGMIDKESDLYLSSPIGIRGIVDEILYLDDGTMAPLDYKFAEYKNKDFKTYRFQLVFYAKLIMENFQSVVDRGFLIYTRSKNKLVQIDFTKKDFTELITIVQEIFLIIQKGYFPKKTSVKARCYDCTYRNICV